MSRAFKSVAALTAGFALLASAPVVRADEAPAGEVVVEPEAQTETGMDTSTVVAEDDSASWVAIAVDLIIGRPTLLMAGVAGAAFYALALPITLPSGTEEQARDTFLLPAQQLVETKPGGKLTPAG